MGVGISAGIKTNEPLEVRLICKPENGSLCNHFYGQEKAETSEEMEAILHDIQSNMADLGDDGFLKIKIYVPAEWKGFENGSSPLDIFESTYSKQIFKSESVKVKGLRILVEYSKEESPENWKSITDKLNVFFVSKLGMFFNLQENDIVLDCVKVDDYAKYIIHSEKYYTDRKLSTYDYKYNKITDIGYLETKKVKTYEKFVKSISKNRVLSVFQGNDNTLVREFHVYTGESCSETFFRKVVTKAYEYSPLIENPVNNFQLIKDPHRKIIIVLHLGRKQNKRYVDISNEVFQKIIETQSKSPHVYTNTHAPRIVYD
jgi:hypothetical protein